MTGHPFKECPERSSIYVCSYCIYNSPRNCPDQQPPSDPEDTDNDR